MLRRFDPSPSSFKASFWSLEKCMKAREADGGQRRARRTRLSDRTINEIPRHLADGQGREKADYLADARIRP
jgi:hypothetical protein